MSFARLRPGVFDEYLFLPDQAKYSAAQQNVAKATTQLNTVWQIDKKISNLRKVKAKNSDDVLKRREAAAKIKMLVEIKSRLSETAALMHLDSIVALRFHPRNQQADMHYTALLKRSEGHCRKKILLASAGFAASLSTA